MTKNATRIGSSILGTWSSEITLVDHHHDNGESNLTAYFLVHFMADPRKQHGCMLKDCNELDNRVCMMETNLEGRHIHNECKSIANEKDVTWSDLNAFFYFGVKVNSKSKPKAKFELTTGEWIGPFNIIMAQDTSINTTTTKMTKNDNDQKNNNETLVLVDRYVARYVESRSTMPLFLQNKFPLSSTLYTRPDDYTTFLGNPVLSNMKRVQINYTIPPTPTNHANPTPTPPINEDPYKSYLQNCDHGNLQPILPLIELEFFNVTNSTNTTTNSTTLTMDKKKKKDDEDDASPPLLEMALKLQYKIMAVPSQDEQAYRVLPQLQSKFQGQGSYNIISGPYCYGDDENRGYSFDISLNSWLLEDEQEEQDEEINKDGHNSGISFVRGCLPGYHLEDCYPPAAMGGIPTVLPNQSGSCDRRHRHHGGHDDVPTNPVVASNVVLMFVAYTLGVALLISITIHFHVMGVQRKKDKQEKRIHESMGLVAPSSSSSTTPRTRGGFGGQASVDDDPDGLLDRLLGDQEVAQFSAKLAAGAEAAAATAGSSEEGKEEEDATKPLMGLSPDPATDQREDINPFGDLDPREEDDEKEGGAKKAAVDPLKEPLLSSQERKEEEKQEAKTE